MFPRLAIHLMLSLLFACGSGNFASDSELADRGASAPPASSLAFEGTLAVVELLPGSRLDLAVRYLDMTGQPGAGVEVEFALTGMASGASLTPARAVTDASGVATTTLRAGNMSGTLQVRARAAGATPVYVDVRVGETGASDVQVGVDYEGVRELTSYTITALDGVTCERALSLGVTGKVVHRIEAPETQVRFELAPGFSTAVVAWGSDATGAQLARGCLELTSSLSEAEADADARGVRVMLSDVPLRLSQALSLELSLTVAESTKRLGMSAQQAVQRTVQPAGTVMFAEADFYLDAMATLLATRGRSAELAQLATARESTVLSASLAPALMQRAVGPLSVGAVLAELLRDRGSILLFETTLGVIGVGPLLGLSAQSADGSRTLPLAIEPAVTFEGRFDESRAALTVGELAIGLDLPSYGRALLAALRRDEAEVLATKLSTAAGCSEVVGPWADAHAHMAQICAAECAIAACEQGVGELVASVEHALAELAVGNDGLRLAGSVRAHDRTADGVVDDLGPAELTGSWTDGDAVSGELREPSRSALTL